MKLMKVIKNISKYGNRNIYYTEKYFPFSILKKEMFTFYISAVWKCQMVPKLNLSNPQNGHHILQIQMHHITMFVRNLNSVQNQRELFQSLGVAATSKWRCERSHVTRWYLISYQPMEKTGLRHNRTQQGSYKTSVLIIKKCDWIISKMTLFNTWNEKYIFFIMNQPNSIYLLIHILRYGL
jgi:hypothetical protein